MTNEYRLSHQELVKPRHEFRCTSDKPHTVRLKARYLPANGWLVTKAVKPFLLKWDRVNNHHHGYRNGGLATAAYPLPVFRSTHKTPTRLKIRRIGIIAHEKMRYLPWNSA